MIAVVYGTTGELIKLAPVIAELERRDRAPLLLCTGQQVTQLPTLAAELDLRAPDRWLARGAAGADLHRAREIPGWAARVLASLTRARTGLGRALRADDRAPFVLVHGDTFTTLLGALAGRALRVPVAHVEAGLRSGALRDPFPEEGNRRLVARLAAVHYAPDDRAVANLRAERAPGAIVATAGNTVADALARVGVSPPAVPVPDGPFGLVSIHRFELLTRPAALRELLGVLHDHSRTEPLLFVDHAPTAAVIDRSPELARCFDDRLRRIPRQSYRPFIGLLRRARFLISDSGGSQEECAALGLPCLVHRAVSERGDGLQAGGSVVLSRLDPAALRRFLAEPDRHRAPPAGPRADGMGPSRRIVDDLAARGAL